MLMMECYWMTCCPHSVFGVVVVCFLLHPKGKQRLVDGVEAKNKQTKQAIYSESLSTTEIMKSRFLILLSLSVIVLIILAEYPYGSSAAAEPDLWASYQGAMVQTIQTRYCQQFLSNYVNFKVR